MRYFGCTETLQVRPEGYFEEGTSLVEIANIYDDDLDDGFGPQHKIGEIVGYWVGDLKVIGQVVNVQFRPKPSIDHTYLVTVMVIGSNKIKPGKLLTDDEIYFGPPGETLLLPYFFPDA